MLLVAPQMDSPELEELGSAEGSQGVASARQARLSWEIAADEWPKARQEYPAVGLSGRSSDLGPGQAQRIWNRCKGWSS